MPEPTVPAFQLCKCGHARILHAVHGWCESADGCRCIRFSRTTRSEQEQKRPRSKQHKKKAHKKEVAPVRTRKTAQGRVTTFDDEQTHRYTSPMGTLTAAVTVTGQSSMLLPDKNGDWTLRTKDTLRAVCVIRETKDES